jgi:hypothetical protein
VTFQVGIFAGNLGVDLRSQGERDMQLFWVIEGFNDAWLVYAVDFRSGLDICISYLLSIANIVMRSHSCYDRSSIFIHVLYQSSGFSHLI